MHHTNARAAARRLAACAAIVLGSVALAPSAARADDEPPSTPPTTAPMSAEPGPDDPPPEWPPPSDTVPQGSATISGTVTRTDGTPLEGARVLAGCDGCYGIQPEATTDAAGTYTISGLGEAAWHVRFDPPASAPELLGEYWDDTYEYPGTDVPTTSSSSVTGIDAALAAGGYIDLTILDEAGQPVGESEAFGSAYGDGIGDGDRTDENGHVLLGPLRPLPTSVSASGTGFGSSTYLGDIANQAGQILAEPVVGTTLHETIRLQPHRRLVGRAVTPAGTPARFVGNTAAEGSDLYFDGFTDENGAFDIELYQPGSGRAVLSDYGAQEDLAPAVVSFTTGDDLTTDVGTVALPVGRSVDVHVIPADPAHPPTAAFAAGTPLGFYGPSTELDENGDGTIHDVPMEPVHIGSTPDYEGTAAPTLAPSAYRFADATPNGPEDGPVTITELPGARLSGHVFGPDGAGAIRGVLVEGDAGMPWRYGQAQSDTDGSWLVEHLAPGTYALNTSGNECCDITDGPADVGYGDTEPGVGETIEVTAASTTDGLDFHLPEGGHLRGRIVDAATGDPVVGAVVQLYSAHTFSGYGSTDDQGRFRIGGLEGDDVRIEFTGYFDFYDPANQERLPDGRLRVKPLDARWYLDAADQAHATPAPFSTEGTQARAASGTRRIQAAAASNEVTFAVPRFATSTTEAPTAVVPEVGAPVLLVLAGALSAAGIELGRRRRLTRR